MIPIVIVFIFYFIVRKYRREFVSTASKTPLCTLAHETKLRYELRLHTLKTRLDALQYCSGEIIGYIRSDKIGLIRKREHNIKPEKFTTNRLRIITFHRTTFRFVFFFFIFDVFRAEKTPTSSFTTRNSIRC